MSEKYNILDSLAGEKAEKTRLKTKAFESSNDLKRFGINDIGQIEDVFKATDYAFMKDPLKFSNLDNKVNATDKSDGLVVCKVYVYGREMDFMINLSDTNGLNKGDILHIDLDKEGKENQTTFSDKFLEHVSDKSEDLSKVADAETILAGLGIKNYEDIIREVSRRNGFEVDKKKAVEGINKNRGFFGNDIDKERAEANVQDGTATEQDKEEVNLAELSEKTGISQDALEKFKEEHGNCKILGAVTVNLANLDKIGAMKGNSKSAGIGTVLRIAGEAGREEAHVMDQDGTSIFDPNLDASSKEENNYLLSVVPEGSNGESVQDIDEMTKENTQVKIGSNSVGAVEVSDVKGDLMSENLMFQLEQEIDKLMKDLDERVNIINEGPGTDVEKARMVEDVCINTHLAGMQLQDKYGVSLPGLEDKTLAIANNAVEETEKEEIKDGIEGVVKGTVVGAAKVIGAIAGIEDEDDGHDPRESHHGPLSRNY